MTNDEMIKELAGLAREARDYQAKHDLTTSRLIREFPGLGSDKTLGLIASGEPTKLEDLDLERWLAEYRATITMMRTLEEKKARKDEVYDDLTTVKHLRLAVMEAMTDRSNSRLVLAVGPSGSGKTTALEMLQKRYGAKRVLLLEADETWKSPGPMLDAIARAPLWAEGLDFGHGTGHGVGSYLSVHEGPQNISKRMINVALKPGMIVSNEPGYYKVGHYGIRIENLILRFLAKPFQCMLNQVGNAISVCS